MGLYWNEKLDDVEIYTIIKNMIGLILASFGSMLLVLDPGLSMWGGAIAALGIFIVIGVKVIKGGKVNG